MWDKIKKSFFTGLVVVLPVVLTVALLSFLVRKVNEKILIPLIKMSGVDFYNPYWIYLAKGVGFLVIIALIVAIGVATRLIVFRRFFGFWERLFLRLPTVGKIYITIKEISRAFLGQGKQVFEKAVLIEYPRKGLYSIGFITTESCQEIQEKTSSQSVYVFLPTSPNPTNGYFLVLPRKEIIPLEMSVADAFKLIVSGGTFNPAER